MTDVAISRYAVYIGRFRVQARLVALAFLTVLISTQHPHPGGHGRSLIILIALVVTVATQAVSVLFPHRGATVRVAVEALACGILAGYDPGTAGVLLVFVGLDAAESLPPANAGFFTGLAVVATVLATVVASNPAADAAYGLVAVERFPARHDHQTVRAAGGTGRAPNGRHGTSRDASDPRPPTWPSGPMPAREIHDILAHNLGALIVQLDAVNALLEGDHPNLEAIRPVLRDAHQHAVDGLAEARHAVSSLREDSQPLEISIRQLTEGHSRRFAGDSRSAQGPSPLTSP